MLARSQQPRIADVPRMTLHSLERDRDRAALAEDLLFCASFWENKKPWNAMVCYNVVAVHALYRVDGHLVDQGFVCFGHILLGQVGIRQNGHITLATMVETTKS